jgi:hypothetical protein
MVLLCFERQKEGYSTPKTSYTIFQRVGYSFHVVDWAARLTMLSDELEYSRLDKQHLVHLLSNDGLVHRGIADRVRAVLDPNNPTPDGSPRRVLDLGQLNNTPQRLSH